MPRFSRKRSFRPRRSRRTRGSRTAVHLSSYKPNNSLRVPRFIRFKPVLSRGKLIKLHLQSEFTLPQYVGINNGTNVAPAAGEICAWDFAPFWYSKPMDPTNVGSVQCIGISGNPPTWCFNKQLTEYYKEYKPLYARIRFTVESTAQGTTASLDRWGILICPINDTGSVQAPTSSASTNLLKSYCCWPGVKWRRIARQVPATTASSQKQMLQVNLKYRDFIGTGAGTQDSKWLQFANNAGYDSQPTGTRVRLFYGNTDLTPNPALFDNHRVYMNITLYIAARGLYDTNPLAT